MAIRFKGGGGGGSGAYGTVIHTPDSKRKGLFAHLPQADPSWRVRCVERDLPEAAVPAKFRFNNLDDDGYLDFTVPETIYGVDAESNAVLLQPGDLNGYTVDIDSTPFTQPAQATRASYEYGSPARVTIEALNAGPGGNSLTFSMQEGRPARQAQDAVPAVPGTASSANLQNAGGNRNVLRISFPAEDGDEPNGIVAQVGPPRPLPNAAVATATFNIIAGDAETAIRIDWFEAGTAGNNGSFAIIYDSRTPTSTSATDLSFVWQNDSYLLAIPGATVTTTVQGVIDNINEARRNGVQQIVASAVSTTVASKAITIDSSYTRQEHSLSGGDNGTRERARTTFNPTPPYFASSAADATGIRVRHVLLDGVSGNNFRVKLGYGSNAGANASYEDSNNMLVALNGLVTAQAIVNAINAARIDIDGTSTQLVEADLVGYNGSNRFNYSGGSVFIGQPPAFINNQRVMRLAGGSVPEVSGTVDYDGSDPANRLLYIASDGSLTASAAATAINALSDFGGTATVLSGRNNANLMNQSVTLSGGVDPVAEIPAVPARDRSTLQVLDANAVGGRRLVIQGILPGVDTVDDLRTAYQGNTTKVFRIVGTGTTIVVPSSASVGYQQNLLSSDRVSLAGGTARGSKPSPEVRNLRFETARTRLSFQAPIWAGDDLSMTLAELRTALSGTMYQYSEGGDRRAFPLANLVLSSANTGDPVDSANIDAATGGITEVAATPLEILVRGDDQGKEIEFRYHTDSDTLQDILNIESSSEFNPGGVQFFVIPGSDLSQAPPDTPSTFEVGLGAQASAGSEGGNPFTDADEAKLDGIEAGAQVNDTAGEIVTKLEGLSGNARLQASAIRNLPSGGGGLSTVSSDNTITGDGSSSNPLSVADPYTQAKVDARVAAGVLDWAEAGNSDAIPDSKIPASIARDTEVTAAIQSGVIDEAQAGNTDPFADSKIPASIARDSELPDVIDELALSLAGNTLTLTAGQTGTSADIVGTVDVSELEEWIGPWGSVTEGTAIRAGEMCSQDGRYYIARSDHNRGNSGPDADSTNWALLNNWGGIFDAAKYYQQGTLLSHSAAIWVSTANVIPSDPDPDAVANTKWRRLGDNVDAFTGATVSGSRITFTRESGSNPVTVTVDTSSPMSVNGFGLAQIGSIYSATVRPLDEFQDTGIPLPANPDDDQLFILAVRLQGSSFNLNLTGAIIKALPVAEVGDDETDEAGILFGAEPLNVNEIYGAKLANGDLLIRNDINLAASAIAGDYYALFEITDEPPAQEDAPPLPVSRAESIGITADKAIRARSWETLDALDAAPEVKFGEGGPIILTRDSASQLTVKRGVYTVWFRGQTAVNAERSEPVFRILNTATTPVELTRSDQEYLRSARAANEVGQRFNLAAELILTADTAITLQVGSAPEANSSPAPTSGGAWTLESDDFEIIFVPTGGSETIFYPQTLGEATFDLTGAAQNVALEDADSNDIIAPDTGYLLATFDVPPLGLTGSTIMVRADRLRAARASTDLTSGLYTDATTHQIFYEVAAHAGGATSGNRILIEHIKTAVPVTPTAPVVDPAITEFETTSGNLSPAAGAIGGDTYGYTLEISQPSHVASARIIGFAGAGTADKAAAFATLATVTDYHDETGRITIPANTELANAGDIYTLRLEVYKTGQNQAADAPIAYHDVRIVAHAPATAAYHWGRIAYMSGENAAQTLARINDFTGDLATGDRLADRYAAMPDNTGTWQFYFLAKSDETQPAGWDSGGLHADAAFYDVQDKTIATVAYKAWILRPTYRRELADGTIYYEPRT